MSKRDSICFFCLLLSILFIQYSEAQNHPIENSKEDPKNREVMAFSQPWAGSDELGRTLPLYKEVGGPMTNRQVGIFYFLWQGDQTAQKHWDLSKIIATHPEVLNDYDDPNWGLPVYHPGGPVGMYYWGEPLYGYYRGDDYWVHLKSMQLLTDAQVDFVVIDATNKKIYPEESVALLKAMQTLIKQGKNPPKIVYYTNTASGETMQKIYDTYYAKDAPYSYPESWYYLDGKPLIIGISKEAEGKDYESFFTFRESQWPTEPDKENGWPWISFTRPQHVYSNSKGEREIVNVSISQHPNPTAGMGGSAFYGNTDNWGRSYHNGGHGNPNTDIPFGYNFQEQWDFALKQDVPFIFITGWNEWIAGRWDSKDGNPEHSWFCDAASPEYSRDIEPTRNAGINDNYYIQMVANIRRYKGMKKPPKTYGFRTISDLQAWTTVNTTYEDYTGDTLKRNHPGAQSKPKRIYTNSSGRNDFEQMKVVNDAEAIYFYAQTKKRITGKKSSNWMRLYINTDRDFKTGWMGYDYSVSKGNTLLKHSNGNWVEIAEINFQQHENKLMYTIPLEKLKLSNNPDIEFKWSDNMQNETDPLDWYINGDTAPGGRFNFIYTMEK